MRHEIARWVAVLALATAASAAPRDPAADFLIDITDLAGEPCGLHLKTKKGYWELPAEQLRHGRGIGLFYVTKNTTNNCEARIYIEVDALDGRTLEEAVTQAAESLPGMLEPRRTEVVGEITHDAVAPHRIGKLKLDGCTLRYSVRVLNAEPVTTDPATALMFAFKGAVVTVTVENYSSTTDYLTPILKGLSIETLPLKRADFRLKFVDATGGSYRYFEGALPDALVPERSDALQGEAIGFLRSHDGKVVGKLRLAKSEAARGKGPREEADYRRSNLLDMYENVSDFEEVSLGGEKAWLCTCREGAEDAMSRISVVYFRPEDVMWTLTWETLDADAKEADEHQRELRTLLKSLNHWTAHPR